MVMFVDKSVSQREEKTVSKSSQILVVVMLAGKYKILRVKMFQPEDLNVLIQEHKSSISITSGNC